MPADVAEPPKTWQQTKSEMTRTAILDAAVTCFYELGYANTTTENVARKAGVSRGAMLHHFPTRFDLIKAAVEHLNQQRLAVFAEAEWRIQRGAEHSRIEEGIEPLLHRPGAFFAETGATVRADEETVLALLISSIQRIEAAGPGSITVHSADGISNQLARQRFLIHS